MTTELARLQNFGPNWFASVMGTGLPAFRIAAAVAYLVLLGTWGLDPSK